MNDIDRSITPGAGDAPAFVGESFSEHARLSEAEIRAFATLVRDHNPLHHDEAVARRPATAASSPRARSSGACSWR